MKNLVTFLKNQNIYPEFYYYFKKNKWFEPYQAISQRKKIYDILKGFASPEEFINHSFYWEMTKEGHFFWLKLNQKWKKYCKENKIQQLKTIK